MTVSFSLSRRCRSVQLASVFLMVAVAILGTACSGQGSATGTPVNAPVRLDMSPMFMTVQNQAGLALTDVEISIVPYGSQTVFTKFLGRLESSEKRDVALGDFSGRDGTQFNARVVRPKAVRIKASDINDKKYEVEYPWK